MMQSQAKYVNPFTDFGFKKLFGEEYSKDLLIDFLNQLLKKDQGRIKTITYMSNEQLGRSELDHRAIFDLYCEDDRGEKFRIVLGKSHLNGSFLTESYTRCRSQGCLVEMQKAKHKFFKDRSVYYSTFPIAQQAKAGDWNFELKAVYTVAILDFVFEDDADELEKFRYDVKLSDIETHKVFYDKLTFIYLEMPKFDKSIDELKTRFDKWLYVLKNLSRLQDIPEKLQDRVFKKLFKAAEIAKFTPEEAMQYKDSLKVYRDLKNTLDTAREEGEIKGKRETARKMLAKGMDVDLISELTELAKDDIELLQPLDDDFRISEDPATYGKRKRKPIKRKRAK